MSSSASGSFRMLISKSRRDIRPATPLPTHLSRPGAVVPDAAPGPSSAHRGRDDVPGLSSSMREKPSAVGRGKAGGRRIAFAADESTLFDRVRRVWKRVASASTGEPSDGLDSASESSTSVPAFLLRNKATSEDENENWFVDEVVVNHEIDSNDIMGSQRSTNGIPKQSTTHHSDSNNSVHAMNLFDEYGQQDQGVFARMRRSAWAFFEPRFDDRDHEMEYQKLSWYSAKPLAIWASLYLYINWVLYLILNRSDSLYEKITFYGGLTLFTVPVPWMIIANWPRKHPVFFQIWFTTASWYCGLTELIQIKQCGLFSHEVHACGANGKDFLAQMFYATAFPMLMSAVYSKRLYNFFYQVVCFVLLLAFIIPVQEKYARNVVSFFVFHAFFMYLDYSREMTDRRMFMLNSQLKIAYRAQQKAQIAESKASQAKRRFASYIFHEVRVPLNTAMLAYQNLQGSSVFQAAANQNQGVEIYAMEASLTMMQQVLNDVLDLQKMDAGRFESSPRPFALHRAISSIMGPVGVATSAKKLALSVELDPSIDALALGQQRGGGGGDAAPPEGLWVVGDEMRLRQILTNLASNAVKFTPDGAGPIRVVTRLLAPMGMPMSPMSHTAAAGLGEKGMLALGAAEKGELGGDGATSPLVNGNERRLVVRLEVHDAGPGIRPSDLVDSRLFQPFVQTRVGKLSGKGSGLGLAIVRQIVHLSGGRLGVQSRKGKGAMFWVELVYNIATLSEIGSAREAGTPGAGPGVSSTSHIPPPKIVSLMRPSMPAAAAAAAPAGEKPTSFGSSTSGGSAGDSDNEFPPPLKPIDLQPTTPLPLAALGAGGTPLPSYVTERSAGQPPQLSPASPTAPTAPPPGPPPATPRSGSAILAEGEEPLAVLVVDDDPMTRTLMTRMLTKLGCAVDSAQDGQQGLGMLVGPTAREYDLVCLDNYMPVMSGEEAVRELRALGRKDLVVGCTGTALTEDQASYLEAGADRVLAKPIMLKDLKAMLAVAKARRTERHTSPNSEPKG